MVEDGLRTPTGTAPDGLRSPDEKVPDGPRSPDGKVPDGPRSPAGKAPGGARVREELPRIAARTQTADPSTVTGGMAGGTGRRKDGGAAAEVADAAASLPTALPPGDPERRRDRRSGRSISPWV